MTQDSPGQARPGRKPQAEKRQTFTFRLTPETRERVQAAASTNGRSVSEELERRVEQSFTINDTIRASVEAMSVNTIERIMGDKSTQHVLACCAIAVKAIQTVTKKHWTDDIETKRAVYHALSDIVALSMLTDTDGDMPIGGDLDNAAAKQARIWATYALGVCSPENAGAIAETTAFLKVVRPSSDPESRK